MQECILYQAERRSQTIQLQLSCQFHFHSSFFVALCVSVSFVILTLCLMLNIYLLLTFADPPSTLCGSIWQSHFLKICFHGLMLAQLLSMGQGAGFARYYDP